MRPWPRSGAPPVADYRFVQTARIPQADNRVFTREANPWGSAHLKRLGLQTRPKDVWTLLYDGPSLVAKYGALRLSGAVNGVPLMLGGMGGLIVAPSVRRQGYGSILSRHVLSHLEHVWQVDAAVCFCLDHVLKFHQSVGWQLVGVPVKIARGGPAGAVAGTGLIDAPVHVLILPFTARVPAPITSLDLRGSKLW